jgi:UDP-N-acetyl-alpha-D-muramoyl-L-alanyl-L-glutamate epimerase
MKYRTFSFTSYEFDWRQKVLTLHYGIDDAFTFQETYRFDFDFADDINHDALERALQLLWFTAGVSYYKTTLPPQISVNTHNIDPVIAGFLERTYQHGLGEFFYTNHLDPNHSIEFPAEAKAVQSIELTGNDGALIGVGGGKDSLVSAELLRDQPKIATWSLNHRPQLTPLIERIGLPHFWVERQWDPQLLDLKDHPDIYNGHVPISAIFACVGTIVAILSGQRDVIVSNESSASEPNLTYRGVEINHQYSKSLAFEIDFQKVLHHLFGTSLRYFSFLRPLSELHISKLFANLGFDTYHDVFSSCNKAFVHSSDHLFWDGTCAKCAFVFLALTPFVEQAKLEGLFGSKNLLLTPSLEPMYRELLGIRGHKPLECVGEIKESRVAMRLAQQKYPILEKYEFDLPQSYDYHSLSHHHMPDEYITLLRSHTRV